MNKTVELVTEWATFEEQHPEESLEAFCRHYLISKREKQEDPGFLEGIVPTHKKSLLTKLLVKIVRMQNVYLALATKDIAIKQPEEFYFLSVIRNLKSPKKTEVIYHTVNELSNGLNILNSLIDQGYISEQKDPEDKRSKRVKITPKGEKILSACYKKIHAVSDMLFLEMPEDDVLLCIQLLKDVELKFSGKWLHHKSKTFEEVYESVTGKKL
ncbi:MAG TPA: winged helix DNA-binding protein [Flavitalea sp.]|nr:winged helix DNA-binding protein [Flavitalea sp.]